MSTERRARPNITRERRNWASRIGDALSILVGGRMVEATLRRVSLDCSGLRPRVRLHVATGGGTMAVSPDAVLG